MIGDNKYPPTHFDELQFQVFRHVHILAHSEDIGDDVVGGVTLVPQWLQDEVGLVNVACYAVSQHLLDKEGVWLITDLQQKEITKAKSGLAPAHVKTRYTYTQDIASCRE